MLTLINGGSQRSVRIRKGPDRRARQDRRLASIDMRLRVGLWYQYHRATRAGEFDLFPRNRYRRIKIEEALMPEMTKYEFSLGPSKPCPSPQSALTSALHFLWAHPEVGCNAAGESQAVYAINAIAGYLMKTYHVSALDRRKVERRNAAESV